MGDSDQQRRHGREHGKADAVVRVVFKVELEADEEPVGRIVIVRGSEASGAVTARPTGRWVGLIEAEEIARRHGAHLVEV